MKLEEIIDRRIVSRKEFKELLNQLKICYRFYDRFWRELNLGWDIREPFENLRREVQSLIFRFSNLYKTYCKDNNKINALNEDLRNFLFFMFHEDLSRRLNNPSEYYGEISTAVQQIGNLLEYIKIIFERIIEDFDDKFPQKFVEHAQRNAGIIPSFEKLRKLETKMGE